MSEIVYSMVTPFLMGILCLLVVSIHVYTSLINGAAKKCPKLVKAGNWLLLSLVYLVDALLSPAAADSRVWFRMAFFLLVLSELAYHGDTIVDIYQYLKSRVKSHA
jgi:hypothetical protein